MQQEQAPGPEGKSLRRPVARGPAASGFRPPALARPDRREDHKAARPGAARRQSVCLITDRRVKLEVWILLWK